MKTHWKKLASLTMALVLGASLLAGCTGGGSSSASSAAPSGSGGTSSSQPAGPGSNADRDKVTIRYSQPNTTLDNVDKIAGDPIKLAIEEAVNVSLEYDSGFDGYTDRIQTELAAGTGADLFPNYGQQELTSKWIADDIVVNIGDIINAEPERYPILHKMINSPEYKMYNQLYAGDPDKTYAIYALTSIISWAGAPLYNADLLEQAGFTETPKTVDEFVEFATNLGKQGVSGWWPRNNTLTNLNEIDKTLFAPQNTSIMYPSGDPWAGFMPVGGKDAYEGEWKLMTTSEETKEMVKVLAQMYADGAMDKGVGTKHDFDVAKVEFFAGQIGAFNHGFSSWGQVSGFVNEYVEANPGATWEDMKLGTVLTGDAGLGVTYSAPYWMGYNWFIPISCDAPDRVLDLLEYLASDAGQELLFHGIEGTHFTRSGSEYVHDEAAWKTQGEIYNVTDGRIKYIPFTYLFAGAQQQLALEKTDNWYEASTNPIDVDYTEDSDFKTYVNGVLDSYKDGVAGFLPPYFTIIQYPEDLVQSRTKMQEITLRYIPAFITGQKDIDAEWPAYVAEYEAAGSKELEAAFNTAKDKAKADFEALAG